MTTMCGPHLTVRMIVRFFLVVFPFVSNYYCVFSLPYLAPRLAQSDDECPVLLEPQPPESVSRIIGGDPSGSELADSIALISTIGTSQRLISTGILVSSYHVVVSASSSINSTTLVYVGKKTASSLSGGITVESVKVHESYNENTDGFYFHDFAILTLSTASTGTPVKVNSNLNFPQNDAAVRIVGYGGENANQSGIGTLSQVDLPVYNFSQCLQRLDRPSSWPSERLFCAFYENRNCSTW